MSSLKSNACAVAVYVCLFCMASMGCARAQWSVYGQGTGANLRFQNTGTVYGGTIGFDWVRTTRGLGLGADFRGTLLGGGDTAGAFSDRRLDLGLLGARASYTRHALTPYVETLLGYGYVRGGAGTIRQDQTSGALQALGGLDVRLSDSFDLRVGEVSYTRVKGQFGSVHPIAVSAGVVFHLP